MNKDEILDRIGDLECEIQSHEEDHTLSPEEIYRFTKDEKEQLRKLERQLEELDELDEKIMELDDILSDYRSGDHPEDRVAIVETIRDIEVYDDYLSDARREELADIKEEIGYTEE